jgi:hypothetical protein
MFEGYKAIIGAVALPIAALLPCVAGASDLSTTPTKDSSVAKALCFLVDDNRLTRSIN